MKEISLTQGKVAVVDDCDYEWLMQWKWHAIKGKGETLWYAGRNADLTEKPRSTTVSMHRALVEHWGESGKRDHKNRNGLDNQRNNLRPASDSQNAANRVWRRKNKNGFRGIEFRKRGNWLAWRAQVKVNQKKIRLGWFGSPVDAAKAYDTAARKYFGEFAVLNFPL